MAKVETCQKIYPGYLQKNYMRIKKGFKMRPLGHEFIVVAEDARLVNFNKMVALNSTAAYLWDSLKDKDFTVDDMRRLLLDKYDVSEEIAAEDSEKVANCLKEAGIIEE